MCSVTTQKDNSFVQICNCMILEGQKEINKQIDELHEKVNTKIGRQELFGWVVAVGALSALVGNLM